MDTLISHQPQSEGRTVSEKNRTSDAIMGFVLGAFFGTGVSLLRESANGRNTRPTNGDTARRLNGRATARKVVASTDARHIQPLEEIGHGTE
jgi:hypothetical protein